MLDGLQSAESKEDKEKALEKILNVFLDPKYGKLTVLLAQDELG